ncbi:transglycosylase SLT domain-containing protein [Bacillus subtilis]|nr:transglycosylase SLT domain-containing protein [Pseudomonas sp. A29(2023)]MDL5596018.1 transglycosylase SLT domain-containing protein [Bacillus subtilis]
MNGYDKIKAEGGPFDSLIQSASAQYGVPYDLLHKQIFLESSFNPRAVSPTGPRGLAQMTAATGLAYGLERDEDFFDPAKSIDAAARHMRDNIQLAGGDQLKALLAYNQGAGRKGAPQLDAYDRGDFSGVSEEGLNYMRKLADVTNTGKRAELDSFVKPAGGFEAPAGIEAQPTVTPGNVPDTFASFNMEGVDVAPKAPTFAQELYTTTGKTEEDGMFTGTGMAAKEALQNSVLGMMIRSVNQEGNADFTQSFTMLRDVFNEPLDGGRLSDWTDEDYDKLRTSGLDPQFYDVVLRGYKRNFDQNLALALENQKLVQARDGATLGAQIIGGAAGMMGDPWSLVNPARGAGAGLASRLIGGAAVGGALGGLSEHSAAKASGKEENLGAAIAGGAAFGGLLNGLMGARPGRNSWDEGGSALDGELLGPEAPQGPAGPGLNNEVPRLESWIDGEGREVPALVQEMNRIGGAANRLQLREKARLAGAEEDPARMPFRDGEEVKESPSGPYIDVPFDSEASRAMDGSIHSGGSPLNPKTVDTFVELDPLGTKAVRGFSMGSLSEIGYKLAASENPEMRGIAYDLFRSPTGYETGSNGKFGATASDIAERLRSQDNVAHNRFAEQLDEVLKDPYWRARGGSEGAKREAISRRVVQAMEAASHGEKTHSLTPAEVKLADLLKEHMAKKWDYIENPGQFGNMSAKSLLEETRHAGSYYPMRYSTAAKQGLLRELGGPEGLQEAIVRSWLASYAKRPQVRARVDKMLQEAAGEQKLTPEALRAAVEKYARDKAYGISHTERFNRSHIVEEHLHDGVGVENNDYLEARNLFDSDVQINLPNGSLFSVDDLREFDILRIVPQYDRRVNGDVALMGGTGKSTAELKSMAIKMRQGAQPGADTTEADALMDALKMFTGRARRDPDGVWQTTIRSLNDIGFVTKNAYMGAQNITEAASLFVKGHQRMLLKGVPLLKKWTTAGSKLAPEDIKDMHNIVFGRELDDLIRPTRQDIVDGLRENHSYYGAQAAGSFKWATGELSVRSPFTWLLRETGNYIMDAGRQGLLVDLIDHTLNGLETKLFTPERLRSASITPEQFKGIQDLIKAHFKRNKAGQWRIKDADKLAADPRSMDLWRLGDAVADETMLRPHKMSLAPSKQYGAMGAMVLQFKMFVMRSLNGRLVRGWMEATRNGQVLDQTYKVAASLALATAFYAASTQLKALGLPQRAREKYLNEALSPSMLAYAAISRSSHVGAPFGVTNFIGAPFGYEQAAMVRTSILPRGQQQGQDGKPIRYSPLRSDLLTGFMSRTAEQIPALGVAAAGVQAGYSGAHLMGGRRGDRQGHMTGLFNALKAFIPNDPVSQNLLQRLAQDQGVDRTR